ncbi:hypothetical protein F4809DRAFT_607670 [Biscogniauxia mediterranea]|nr:hypothetical protein F4809DRAFT_607670 [Biscogniauxia mediterranea]
MGTLPHVLHTAARPIKGPEFIDAVRAACPPRFPRSRGDVPRQVSIAVSGGVDSMALAFLCTQFPLHDPSFRVSDNPVSCFRSIIIDHGLRHGSRAEAVAVQEALRHMGMKTYLQPLSWAKVLLETGHKDPNDLPNLESVARRLRYRTFGRLCREHKVASLFLAHHEDDQYETVLMRLLQGHGTRGLRGMKKAGAIPECEGMLGAYQSGYVDDQRRPDPYYSNKVRRRDLKRLKRELRSGPSHFMDESELDKDFLVELDVRASENYSHTKQTDSGRPPDIEVEDGGIFVYRPLIEFSKKRLIATCLANRIPWWEDHTNQDPTLTMRNAIRYMCKGYTLPVALQKPSILALSKRCEQKIQNLDVAANRLLSRAVIHGFEPNVGTLTIELPVYELPRSRRYLKSSLRRDAYITKQREVAGLVIQKFISIVTPNLQPAPLVNLQNAISFLFPALSDPEEVGLPDSPKPFNVSGVYFIPVRLDAQKSSALSGTPQAGKNRLTWFLTREPYTSTLPVPSFRTPYWAVEKNTVRGQRWDWSPQQPWTLWDGRFWIRIMHRLPYRVIVQPFVKEHAKPFREQLDPPDRKRLEIILRRYAPGKVRYTMPAIYLEEEIDFDNVNVRRGYPHPRPPTSDQDYDPRRGLVDAGGESVDDNDANNTAKPVWQPRPLDISKMKLLALPTIDMQIPKVRDWLSYEIRYKRVDRDILKTAGEYYNRSFVGINLG